MTDARVVLTTTDSQHEASRIATELVERRLAACVNIIPQIESIYRWEGKMERSSECLLIIKTEASAFDRLRDAIQELHSYDVPECIMLEITHGSETYLQWIKDNTEEI